MTSNGEVQAVRGVSFSVKKKEEILGIVGESGSGKSVTSVDPAAAGDTARIKEGKNRF